MTASLNNSPLPSATTVTVNRTGGTAASGTDYPAIGEFTVTIPAGRTSATTTLSFDPTGDSLAEGDETVVLTGSSGGLSDGTVTLTITDDDAAPTAVSLSLDPDSVVESAAATEVTVTASLNNSPLPSATTVTVNRTGGTATPGTDYPAISNFTVTIPAGVTSGTTTLSFDPTQGQAVRGRRDGGAHRQRRWSVGWHGHDYDHRRRDGTGSDPDGRPRHNPGGRLRPDADHRFGGSGPGHSASR